MATSTSRATAGKAINNTNGGDKFWRRIGLGWGGVIWCLVATGMGYWAMERWMGHEAWKAFFLDNIAFLAGIPLAAATAFAIVAIFSVGYRKDALEFKVFGQGFHGPAAPVMLWVACFLSLVLALYVLKPAPDPSILTPDAKSEATSDASTQDPGVRSEGTE
jgi:hypothetical protein